ncbi:ABC transporter ATP-binding protein [Insolitispirillum peregrinum]|uniref:ABC transporter ATP-binding protein n=1 Tax=Insolitispirillum peregrinum TaxID=80876 RepID=UPI00360C70FC
MKTIIQLENVSKIYTGGFKAVDGINLGILEGEFVTLLGPSGCGKTTTLRMLAGFEEPTRGRISLDGQDITDSPPYRRPINTVFQDYALFPHLSVLDNVAYGLRTGKRKLGQALVAERVKSALGMVGLLGKADNRPGQLSGGQRQRVAMARALACQPRVLLLDEPLSALDVKLREKMQVELKQLHQQLGITFLMVTHDQKEALVMSDRIVVMHDGKIAQIGTPEDLYDRPASAYVADFIGASNLLHGKVSALGDGFAEVDLDGAVLRGRLADSARGLAVGDAAVISLRPERVQRVTGSENKESLSVFEARVMNRHFHGYDVRLDAKIGGRYQDLAIDLRRDSIAMVDSLPPMGEVARFAMTAADALVFAEDQQ